MNFKFRRKYEIHDISILQSKTLVSCERGFNEGYGEYVLFVCTDNTGYVMYHDQSCCENVYIESIVGDLSDLVGTEILVAEERQDHGEKDYDSFTWTFYTLRTIKGSVDIRWYGTSNGYYSEEAIIREALIDQGEDE